MKTPPQGYDVTVTEDDEGLGRLVAHRPDCPVVDRHRTTGRPLMTMFDCQGPLPIDLRRCACLKRKTP
jgi:hypothetical protein